MKPHYSNTNNPIDFPKSKNKMNEQIEHCLYQAGLTAQGCWDKMDAYDKQAIQKFAELIVKEMLQTCEDHPGWSGRMIGEEIKQHFGVEE
jgi:hypothetical protein